MIEYIAKTKKPIILSSGISNIRHIQNTLKFIRNFRNINNVILLHCVSSYPTPTNQANLNKIRELMKISRYVGYEIIRWSRS